MQNTETLDAFNHLPMNQIADKFITLVMKFHFRKQFFKPNIIISPKKAYGLRGQPLMTISGWLVLSSVKIATVTFSPPPPPPPPVSGVSAFCAVIYPLTLKSPLPVNPATQEAN